MKTIIVVRALGIKSEHWLKRQIQLLGNSVERVVVLGLCPMKTVEGIPITSLALEYELKYKILSKLFKKDISDFKREQLEDILTKSKANSIIFHFIDFSLNFKEIIHKTKKNVFVYCHGYDITWDLKTNSNPNESYFKESYKTQVVELSKDVYFIANSISTSNKLQSIGVPVNKIRTKYFGVEQNIERNLPNEFTILYLGRLVDFKGPHMVIKAFEFASKKGMKAKLIFAGDGPLRATLELMRLDSKFKNNIEILGAVDYETAQTLYKKASIFVAHNCLGQLSNQEEAFGVSILEAMSFGIPVITGASGGPVETILHGKTGYLFEPFNVEEQADYFLQYYNNKELLVQHGKNAKLHIEECFSLEKEYKWFQEILSIDEKS
ncbi:glycosyltransferase (GT4) [Formosa agariphila KMM 3901]|uniref:Glycosyltransferase (GT4) n=1 Tax=Formosa agariphila (strain DSM 15362 / KCTC 12365 / LMG 23005 / KMM 3901 / M-2Alg 35-1) TaxID=1347342 RepID=T2KQ55_FORAG|nr:glycosyltransferase family 4 protein [Formosa agariphila]CDF80638.1 glycosyltransferase (GT4) [Formosa agariphila KMM 3901]